MPQKIKSFLAGNWFSILTIFGMLIHGWYTLTYAQADNAQSIAELKKAIEPMREIPTAVLQNTGQITELKRFITRQERNTITFQRNMDRLVWVVDALAEKNGIKPPNYIPDSKYE
jgi:hypothetical protein